MPAVHRREGEDLDSLIRRFKKECEREGILSEIKKREFFVPPSVEKRKKKGKKR
ncbi:MAG TPA: 30S ribosomal protein S21 [Caldisericia bacterium]|nr:30S ribosomal protein S21 [Caldisericia bacterium]NLI55472.1 30S ribosomal protein S21 [bacterium]HOC53120.1 30S ribosomal protein S21 [Caldisericia bacterium]HOK17703.1 30S ribosomal protein S21 [Caldisericia bacterium]HOL82960.1 30S ribosomal protein S21 [Caldisericia bacterium]